MNFGGLKVVVNDGRWAGWTFAGRVLAVALGEREPFRPRVFLPGPADDEVLVDQRHGIAYCNSAVFERLRQAVPAAPQPAASGAVRPPAVGMIAHVPGRGLGALVAAALVGPATLSLLRRGIDLAREIEQLEAACAPSLDQATVKRILDEEMEKARQRPDVSVEDAVNAARRRLLSRLYPADRPPPRPGAHPQAPASRARRARRPPSTPAASSRRGAGCTARCDGS